MDPREASTITRAEESHLISNGGAVIDALHRALELHREELRTQNDELRRTNEELRAAHERAHTLFEHAPVAYLTLDAIGVIVEANLAATRLLRSRRDQVIGRRFEGYISSDFREDFQSFVREVFHSGGKRGTESVIAFDTTNEVQVLIEGVRVRAVNGTGDHCLMTVVDITERSSEEDARRDLERRILRAQRLESLAVMAGGVAHDFNNLLLIVLSGADLAMHDLGQGSRAWRLLADLKVAARRAAELARQMLAYSGKGSTLQEPVDLILLLRDLEPLLRASAGTAQLRMELAASVPIVDADPTQVRQVFLNLVINAGEAIGDRGGRISVKLHEEDIGIDELRSALVGDELTPGRYVVIEVQDDGPGMDPSTVGRIFDPYFSTKFQGRGLGLAVVQGIVRRHKGAVIVESEVGQGTTFRVILPASTRPPPAARVITQRIEWHGRGTVLVVDDEESVCGTSAELLGRLGFQVVTAKDGVDALEMFEEHQDKIAAVLLDATMPRMGGIECAQHMHKKRPEIPVFLMSGFGEVAPEHRDLFAASIQKPFDYAELGSMLRKVLG